MSTDVRALAGFIGRGWSFPLRVTSSGGIGLTTGTEEIEASLRMILLTAPGERVMRPTFGCSVWDLVFAPVNANTLGAMRQAVEQAIGQWEPRVEVENIRPQPDPDDPARVLVEIEYRIKATNDLRNLVFPFYVIPREEGGA